MEKLYKKVMELPDTPGVYFFLDEKGKILYIGKATSLKDRIKSYFGDDLMATRGRRLVDMMALAHDIKTESTLSVLEALILEANLIKKHEPKYNAKEKDNKSFNYVVVTKEDFPKIFIIRGRTMEALYSQKSIKYSWGPFTSGSALREALKIIRRIFPFRDEKCVVVADQVKMGRTPRPCFNRQIGLCPGTCTGEISKQEYVRTINHIRLFFEGKKQQLIKVLEKEMNALAKTLEFEKATKVRRQLFSLEHINDVAIIKQDLMSVSAPISSVPTPRDRTSGASLGIGTEPRATSLDTVATGPEGEKSFRIEAYDIAHLSGSNTVGVMTVVEDGEAKRGDYRKFKIRKGTGRAHDAQNLGEVLSRRLEHIEWPLPNIIVVDGNKIQINVAEKILTEKNIKNIQVVSVVKDNRHKAREILGPKDVIHQYETSILRANAEAHRFAIAYHRLLRSKQLRNRSFA